MKPLKGETDHGWGWLQVPCWYLGTIFQALKPARFSLIVAVIGGAVFLGVPQGVEILRSLAEGDQYSARFGSGDRWRILYFLLALLLWSFNSWYWARVLLNACFKDSLPVEVICQNPVRWLRREGPRILGMAPFLIVAAAFFVASYSYASDATGHPRTALWQMGAACILLAGFFYVFCLRRRQRLAAAGHSLPGEKALADDPDAPDRRFDSLHRLRTEHGGAFLAVAGLALLSCVLLVFFTLRPVETATSFGSGAILLLAASTWVCFGSCLVYVAGRYQLPLIRLLLGVAVVFSLVNDNHSVRLLSDVPLAPAAATGTMPPGSAGPIAQAFLDWHAQVQAAHPAKLRPVFIAAASGGGIRAAYWAATVLGTLQDGSLRQTTSRGKAAPDFASHLFAISGVSGGSLGAAVFDALVAEKQLPSNQNFTSEAEGILGQDFLSPTLASMLFPDLLQRFWFWPVQKADRGRVLEEAWESGWRNWLGPANDRFAQPLRALWLGATSPRARGGGHVPALFLNGTSVKTGKRVLASSLHVTSGDTGELIDVEDVYGMLGRDQPAALAGTDLRLSTAAHLSARFTYVSPAGLLPNREHVVDGGYFENSGAATALEIVRILKRVIREQQGNWPDRVVPVVLMISNAPVEPRAALPPETIAPTPAPSAGQPSTGEAVIPAAGPSGPLGQDRAPTHSLEFLGELLDPLRALLQTQDSRGSYSEQAISDEQNAGRLEPPPTQAGVAGSVPAPASADGIDRGILNYKLLQRKVPLPLGWMLSGGAAIEMREQVKLDDPTQTTGVQNDTNVQAVLRALRLVNEEN